MDMLRNELMLGVGEGETQTENRSMFPAKVSLAMSYVPDQRFENLYSEEKALANGTLFACLDLPFHGGKERR